MLLAGKTEAGSVEVQPARDSQPKATNCRWDGSLLPSHFTNLADNSELCNALKKPDKIAPPTCPAEALAKEEGGFSICRRQESLKTRKWICPIHAEPIQYKCRSIIMEHAESLCD